MTVGIVEDEAIIALDLKKLMQACGCTVLFQAHNVLTARMHLAKYTPDLLFLDIQLNDKPDGIMLAKELPENVKHVFITSFSDKASIIQATETAPVGYITKPYKEADIFAIINLFINGARYNEIQYPQINTQEFLIVPDKGKKRKIFTDEIIYIEAWGNYVKIFLQTNECILYKISVRKLLPLLNPDKFIRIHRKTIANCTKLERADFQHVYIGQQRFAVGRNYTKEVKKHFKTSVIH
jgi:DNA-binding LytR/AlgR family response regulator